MRLKSLLPVALLGLLAATAAADSRYILQVDSSQAGALAARYGLQVIRTDVIGGLPVALVSAPLPLPQDAVYQLQLEPAVQGVDADQDLDLSEGDTTPSLSTAVSTTALQDALAKSGATTYYGSTVRLGYVSQPATTLIAMDAVHRGYAQGAGIVAVIDTGVDPAHPALQSALLPGYDFTRDLPGTPSEWLDLQPSPAAAALAQSTVAILDQKNLPVILNQSTVAILDQSTVAILDARQLPSAFGHGTMVAGLIHLVAPDARILPLKAFRADGTSDMFQVVRAIYYAVDHGANVINMSFSVAQRSAELTGAIQYANNHGVFCVASVGNDGLPLTVYPAAYPGVLGVGSTTYADTRSSFSNYGPSVFTAAPGEALITAYPGNNYAGVWGTSFSTALVSGAVSLLLDRYPNLNLARMSEALEHGQPLDPDMGMGESRLHLLKIFTWL